MTSKDIYILLLLISILRADYLQEIIHSISKEIYFYIFCVIIFRFIIEFYKPIIISMIMEIIKNIINNPIFSNLICLFSGYKKINQGTKIEKFKSRFLLITYKKITNKEYKLYIPYNRNDRNDKKISIIKNGEVIEEFLHPHGVNFLCSNKDFKCDEIEIK